MKVSFDFDSTLSRKAVQKFAKELIQKGYEVHIVTSRFEDPMNYIDPRMTESGHRDMFRVCHYLNIPRERIHFTNMEDKYHYFKEHPEFLFHLDDDDIEVALINVLTSIPCVHCDEQSLWKNRVLNVLKKGL